MRDQPPEDDEDRPEPQGTLHPISGRALTTCVVLGLVLGWALHPAASSLTGEAPMVSWLQVLALVLVAAIMSFLAWHTWRTVQVKRQRLEVHHAVNRLVLARACALVGALLAGGYAGFAVSWVGDPSERADQWLVRSLVAALAATGITVASILLERACRAPGGDERA